MVARNWNWWPGLAAFGLRDHCGLSPVGTFPEDGEPRIGVIHDPLQRPIKFEAVGLSSADLAPLQSLPPTDDAFSDVFAVIASDESAQTSPSPVAGTYWIDGSRLTFIPRQLLRAGQTYQAVLRLRDSATSDNRQVWAMTIQREVDVPEHRPEAEEDDRLNQLFTAGHPDSTMVRQRHDAAERAFPLDKSHPDSASRASRRKQDVFAGTGSIIRSAASSR